MREEAAFPLSIAPPLDNEYAVRVAAQAVREAASAAARAGGVPARDVRVGVSLSDGTSLAPLDVGTLPTAEEQCYRVHTRREGAGVAVDVVAGGALGAAYGLAWIADRLRTGNWPPDDRDARPRFAQRFAIVGISYPFRDEPPYVDMGRAQAAVDGAATQLDAALLAGATAVLLYNTQYLIPWGDDRLGPRSAACREIFADYLGAAHDRRLRVYSMGDEFLYLPDWLRRAGVTLSTDDPKLWDALKAKYRDLFRALPALDGIATRTGEVMPLGPIAAWDVVHTGEDRSIEGNYRRFLKAMHEVVVGEFGRQYLHRTWTVNTWEQASVPSIFAHTFTDDVPRKNLFLSIKITTGDQWEWQPINPTYGLTPHATVAHVETARAQGYFSGPPDFAVEFAQAGLEFALERGATGTLLTGTHSSWQENLWAGMDYVVWRLAWDPYQPVRRLVADWARATIGPEIAGRVADFLLDTDDIYRDGFHIRGPAYHTWEPLIHVRTGWICKGNPYLDGGRGQCRFLRELYLMAKPELELCLRTMAEHTARYDRWLDSYRGWLAELADPERGRWLEAILARGQDALHINLAYVTGFLRYFAYADEPTDETRARAAAAVDALEPALKQFRARMSSAVLDFTSADNVQGIDEFLKFARRGLADLEAAERAMAAAPDDAGVARILDEARRRDEALIAAHPDAPCFFRWRGIVDGRDVFRIFVADGRWTVEHCHGDAARTDESSVGERPSGPGRFAVRDVEGRHRGREYILEQPSEANGQVLSLLVEDTIPSYGVHDFRIYWIAG